MKLNRLHKVKEKQIELKGFFNDRYVKNEWLYNEPLMLTLKETKAANFTAACEDERFICVRDYVKHSTFTVGSFFVRVDDKDAVLSLLLDTFIKADYSKISKDQENSIRFILELCKKYDVKFSPFKTKIIDFICDRGYKFDFIKAQIKKHPILFKTLIINRFTKKAINEYNLNILRNENPSQSVSREHFDSLVQPIFSEIGLTKSTQKFEEMFKQSFKKSSILVKNKGFLDNTIKQNLFIIAKKQKSFEYNGEIMAIKGSLVKDNIDDAVFFVERLIFELKMIIKNDPNFIKNYNKLVAHIIYSLIVDDFLIDGSLRVNKNTFRIKASALSITESIKKEKTYMYNSLIYIKDQEFISSKGYNCLISLTKDDLSYKELIDHFFDFESSDWEAASYQLNIEIDAIFSIIVNDLYNKTIKKFINKFEKLNVDKDTLECIEKECFNNAKLKIKKSRDHRISLNNSDFLKAIELYRKGDLKTLCSIKKSGNIAQSINKATDVSQILIEQNSSVFKFEQLFPKARERNREIIFMSGATNSGKTYAALEELKKHNKGVYLAPLRLLAIEGQEEIENRGLTCSMVTGEEQDLKENASFISSTIEMADFNEVYDVAIIDEIQMLDDRDRGDAWLKAFYGINAKKVIVVGAPYISSEIEKRCSEWNEKLTTLHFDRKNELNNNIRTLKKIKKNKALESGTAIIAFSIKDIEYIANHLSSKGYNVSKIYGSLPPEIRRYESNRFKTGESDILISTDSIGMGLNLPIKTIVFYDSKKFDGDSFGELKPELIQQIAGRAGRFGIENKGYVIGANEKIHSKIQNAMKKKIENTTKKYKLKPSFDIISELSDILNENNLAKLFRHYHNFKNQNDIEFKTPLQYLQIAKDIEKHKELSLQEKFIISSAPVDEYSVGYLKSMVNSIVSIKQGESIKIKMPSDKRDFDLQKLSKRLDILSYLAFRFKEFNHLTENIKEAKKILYKNWKKNIDSSKNKREKTFFHLEGKPEYNPKDYYHRYY